MVMLAIAVPLWNGFREPGNVVWNVFLAMFLSGLAVAAILLQLHFRRHPSHVGEARFDTANKSKDA
jgi:hypothetical protein